MATQPTFFDTPFHGSGLVSAANTNLDGTGSLVTLIAAIASDGKLEFVRVRARQTTTAGMIRLFLFDGSATYRLLDEIPVTAVVMSAGVAGFTADRDYSGIFAFIPSGWSLVASTHIAEAFNVHAWGARR
jgi:hypothetical protein